MTSGDATFSLDLSGRELVLIEGPAAADYLNRLCTLDTRKVAVGEGSRPFLLSAVGKIQVAFDLSRIADEVFWATTPAGHSQTLLERLDMYHFGEPLSFKRETAWAVVGLTGSGAGEWLSAQGLPCPDAPLAVATGTQDGQEIRVVRNDHAGIATYELWSQSDEALAAARALPELPAEVVQAGRIAGLRGEWPAEFGPHSSPLEVSGLAGVSEGKGCYPGQEVIERTLALGRPPRVLAYLHLDAPVEAGATLHIEGAKGGLVTSVGSAGPQPIALALIKRKVAAVGLQLDVGGVVATVQALGA